MVFVVETNWGGSWLSTFPVAPSTWAGPIDPRVEDTDSDLANERETALDIQASGVEASNASATEEYRSSYCCPGPALP